MPRFVVESGQDAGSIHQVDRPLSTIGRSVSNAIQVVDRRMSRNHAEVQLEGGRVYVRDLESKNGTFVNGKNAVEPIELGHNDRVRIGDTVLRFEAEEVPGSPGDSSTGGSQSSSSSKPGTGANTEGDSSSTRIRLVEEHEWGSTRGERRAGYDPNAAPSLESTSIMDFRDVNRRLEILYQVTDAIRSVLDLEELLETIIGIIQMVVRPDRTYMLMIDDETGELEPRVVKVREGEDPTEVKISTSIANRCLNDGVSLLVSDTSLDSRFNAAESIIMNAIRTAMVAPLIYKGASIGVIYVDTQSRSASFTEEELDMLTSIANQASVAITNAKLQGQLVEQHKLAREMEIARGIQMNLLPKTYPDLPGYQLSAMSLPAKQVGGDYYDFLKMPDGRLGIAIADVSGKGVPAAILTAVTRSYLQSETQHKDSTLAQTVSRMNRMVCRDVTNDMYVTMFISQLEPVEGELEFVNGGHAHPILISPAGKMEFLEEGGIFLGIDDSACFRSAKVTIPPGGLLVCYTDGVSDIQNSRGDIFGTDKFYEILLDKQHLSAEDIRNAVYQACLKHRGSADQFDDFTLIVLKRLDFNESELD